MTAIFKLDQLELAPENPRSEDSVDVKDVETLAANIKIVGLLTPLIGYEDKKKVYITAGGRRLRAMRLLAANGDLEPIQDIAVTLMAKDNAIHAGRAEQLTHKALTDLDVFKLIKDDILNAADGLTDHALADALGVRKIIVTRCREALKLPQPMIDAVLAKSLTVDQAFGLTLFAHDSEEQERMFKRVQGSNFSLEDLRDTANRERKAWEDALHGKLISKDDYLNAGGTFTRDLFGNEDFIDDMDLFLQLHRGAMLPAAQDAYPGYGTYFLTADYPPTYGGIDIRTEAEVARQKELQNLVWDQERSKEERDALNEELDGLRAKMRHIPDEAKSHLGVAVAYNTYGLGYQIRPNAFISDDREIFYENGWLERPDEKQDASEKKVEDEGLSNALQRQIVAIKRAASQAFLLQSPDEVFKLAAVHLRTHENYRFSFSYGTTEQPECTVLPVLLTTSIKPKAIEAMTTEEQHQQLAIALLHRLSVDYQHPALDAALIRAVFTPDTMFLKRYKRPMLLQMAQEVLGNAVTEKSKAADLASYLADHAKATPDWLPIGFLPKATKKRKKAA